MNKPQVILDGTGQPAFAVIPWHEYERLVNEDADARVSDEELYDRAKAEGGESFPIEVVDRLLAGENPIRVFRTYRGMTQNQLAAAVGINAMYLSQIETGKRTGSIKILAALANALHVGMDDLI
ncbi:MAG: helix-turn-helix transcriptional regulator [Bryobacterales bacterium]|nr:helix-turn-helix transcriptional regulator [Bryobacterales bacterium]